MKRSAVYYQNQHRNISRKVKTVAFKELVLTCNSSPTQVVVQQPDPFQTKETIRAKAGKEQKNNKPNSFLFTLENLKVYNTRL